MDQCLVESKMSFIEEIGVIVDDKSILTNCKRPTCPSCRRPLKVCWCQFLPSEKLKIKTTIYILQHPYEESRCLQTAAMLVQAFEESHCKLYRGKHFSKTKYSELHEVARQHNSILLFPSVMSVDLKEFAMKHNDSHDADLGCQSFNLFVLDGTWSHAKGIYFWNEFLHDMKQVKLSNTGLSRYTIRTQPTDAGLSTVESVAIAINLLEKRPDIYEVLMKPLEAMCNFQLQNGAVIHHSKEHLSKMGLQYPMKNKKQKVDMVCSEITDTLQGDAGLVNNM